MAGLGGFGDQGSGGQSRAPLWHQDTPFFMVDSPPVLVQPVVIISGILAEGHRQGRIWGSLQPSPALQGARSSCGQDCWLSRAAKIKLQQSSRAGEDTRAGQEARGPACCWYLPLPSLWTP